MKNNGLLKYIVAVLLFAFSFTLIVNAETEVETSLTVGTDQYFVSAIDYYGTVSCEGVKLTSSSTKTVQTAKGGTITFHPGGAVSYAPPAGAKSGDTDKFYCVYDIRDNEENVKYTYSVTIFKYEATVVEEVRELTLDHPYYTLQLGSGLRVITDGSNSNGCPNPTDGITSTYFECIKCYDDKCEFHLKENVTIPDEGVEGHYNILYGGNGGLATDNDAVQKTIKLKLIGKMDKGVFAYGGAGTCNWNSQWQEPLERELLDNNTRGNTKMHKFTGVNDQVTLPSECKRDSSSYPLPLKFEGWVLLESSGPDRQAVNTCKNFGIVNSTIKYEAGKEQRYGACYTMSGVMVYSSEVTIDDGNWSDTGLGYHINKTLNPTLPNATPRIISLNPSAEFIGYSTRNGDCSGTLAQPGEAAVVGGAYYACVRVDTTDATEQELNIKLNDKQDYIPGAGRVKGCTSENTEYVLADYSNGACVITGIKRTYQYRTPEDESDDYVIVKVLTDRSGTQLTLKIHVLGDDDMPVIDLDGYTLDSSSGAQLSDEDYGERGDVISGTCGVYTVEPNSATRKESGIVVGQVSQTGDTAAAILRVHFYQGHSKCGVKQDFVGICMDPGREEPSESGSNYIKERDLDPKNNKFDRLISYIYTDTNFIKDVNDYQENGANSGLKYLVSATVAIRLGAIIYDEDSNNLGMGLDGYYVAYKTVADNITAQTGGDYSKTTASMLSTGAVQFNEPYASIAADFIAKGYTYEGGWGELKATVTDTTTDWNEAKTEYTKTIKGTLSGLNLFTKAALTLNSNCTGVFAGKCKLYIKNLETQDFDAYADGINYFQNATYVDRNGNLYYKYVIGPVSVSQVAKAVKDYKASGGTYGGGNGASAEGGNGAGGAGGPFDSVLTANYASPDAKGNVVKTIAKGGVNIQSMILYTDASGDEGISYECPDGYEYRESDKKCHKKSHSGGIEQGGTGDDPETVEPIPHTEGGDWSVELGAEIDSDGQPIRLTWIHEYYQIGTLLPACDITKDIFDYKTQGPNFDKDLFKMAGCCSFVFDHSSEFYKSTCSEMCIYNSVTPVCTFNESSDKDYDVTKIVEAREGDSDNYSCIISANESAPYTNTANKKDPAGNKYMLEEFEGNYYCRVSCKEDWQFNFPSLKNYVGANAVRAGSFFLVKDKNVFIGGTRTCVSTKIQHGAYEGNVLSTAPISVDNFDLWQTHGAILDAYDQAEYDSLGTYEYCDGEMKRSSSKHCGGTSTGAACTDDTGCEGETKCSIVYGDYYCDGTKKKCADWHVNPNVPIEFKYAVMPNTDDVTLDTVGWGPVDGKHGFQPFAQDIVMGHEMSTTDGTAGDCVVDKTDGPDKEDAKAVLYEELGLLSWTHEDGKGAMQAANAQLASFAANIAQCDNWQLYTKHTKSAGTIYTVFEPSITFEYDETEYMKEIGSNNILTRNEALNEKCTSVDEANGCPEVARKSYKTGTFYKCNGGTLDPVSYTGCTEVAIVYDGNGNETNGTTTGPTHLVCAAGGDGFSIVGASKESSGHTTQWHTDDGCFYVTFSHLDADYIKRSISEGSYYKSPYTWYINKITDVKIYARTLAEYARMHPTSGADKLSQWSPLGTSQVEESVFPVMVKTPRNMYKYKYTLTQVGMYANSSDVGRIMGGSTAIFSNNNRICFYEVVEQICKCCADRIDTHVKVGDVKTYSNDGTDNRKINTAEALAISGYDYQVSNFSSPTVGSEGRLGYLTSTVSLGDIMANRGKDETSTIWSNQSIYMVSGVDQVTAQGAMLKGYIEDNANKIYDATPEYSYTLTPSAMSGIRRYNEAYGFQPNVNTLKAYGYIKYQNNAQTGWLGKMYSKGETPSDVHFTHYGSRFLEENAAPYVTKDYKDAVLTNKSDICYMVIEKSANDQEANPDYKGASTKLYKGYDGQSANYKDCRWIDVVQKTTNKSNTGTVLDYSRLAFK